MIPGDFCYDFLFMLLGEMNLNIEIDMTWTSFSTSYSITITCTLTCGMLFLTWANLLVLRTSSLNETVGIFTGAILGFPRRKRSKICFSRAGKSYVTSSPYPAISEYEQWDNMTCSKCCSWSITWHFWILLRGTLYWRLLGGIEPHLDWINTFRASIMPMGK